MRRTSTIAAFVGTAIILGFVGWTSLHYDDGAWDKIRHNPFRDDADQNQVEPTHPQPSTAVTISPSTLRNIHNATLGFQKIFVLSMPDRRDKRDIATLAALVSGLEIEFIDGVPGSGISKKERPDNWEKMFNTDNTVEASLGCWRGHMDIYRKMVQERIQSALVIEDDADWDVMIKAQMTEVAKGSQYIQSTEMESPSSPYGNNWWYIATGHCSVSTNTGFDQKHWVISDDPTVVPEEHRDMPFFTPNTKPKELSGKNKRLVFAMDKFMCTGSYAVSLKGASKFIYDQEVQLNAETIDMALGKLCGREGKGRCLGVYPPVTGIYTAAGDRSRGSDRVKVPEGEKQEASANRLVYSTRLHLGSLLEGQTIVKSQFPKETLLKQIDISTFQLPEGKPVMITKSDYSKADG